MSDYLSVSAAINKAMKAPCSAQIRKIINKECDSGNLIKSFDKISLNIDESYYMLLLCKKSKEFCTKKAVIFTKRLH